MAAVWRDPETKARLRRDAHYRRLRRPHSDQRRGAQIFTIICILTGLRILVALLAAVAENYIEQKSERTSARERLRERRAQRRASKEAGTQ